MHESLWYFIIHCILKEIKDEFVHFIPRSKLTSVLDVCVEWQTIIQSEIAKLESVPSNMRKSVLYEILLEQPAESRCYPILLSANNRFMGMFSIEKTEDMIRLCRPCIDFSVENADVYYSLILDFIFVCSLMKDTIKTIEFDLLWGWGELLYYHSKVNIKKLLMKPATYVPVDHAFKILFDGKKYTPGTFFIEKCSAMSVVNV